MGSGLSLLVLSRSDLQQVVFCETYDLKHAKDGAIFEKFHQDLMKASMPTNSRDVESMQTFSEVVGSADV
eukprot:SAG22_NODE_1992_length_3194_cov_9.023910_2_plen_70_part_00